MRLNKIQNNFRDLMLDHPDALHSPPEDLAAMFETGDIALPERLKIYRNNIVNTITDALADKLPTIEALVGREFLTLMARSFALENPPTGGCLNIYGAGFPEFIEGFELAKSLPYLPDMARLELSMNAAYYAADDTALTPQQLGAIAPEDLDDITLKPRAAVHLVDSKFPLLAIKDFCEKNKEGENNETLDISVPGQPIMVYRPALAVKLTPLGQDEFDMLSQLSEGRALGDAVETIIATYPDFDFAAFLQKHMALETFLPLTANK